MVQTYRILCEKILTTFYGGVRSDDSTFSLKHIAQLLSEEIADAAHRNAFENSNAGEPTYSNDTFIVTYRAQQVQYDSLMQYYYVPLPAMPTALPSNQEVEKVWITGARKVTIIPMNNRSKFAQDLLGSIRGTILYYIENGNIVFDNPTMFNFSTVNINLIGAMPSGALLDAPLLMPKGYEAIVSEKIIQRLLSTAKLPRDVINDAQPTVV